MAEVRTGLDRLIEEGLDPGGLSPQSRIALLAHSASISRTGRHVIEWLATSGSPRLERIFAPEHGLWGHEQDMEIVGDTADAWSGRPVISLYGDSPATLRPTAAHLDGLDAVLVDLQDVGSRYYTFVYTLAYVMEAAGETGLPVVVLDRPNPIGGGGVEGPVLDPDLRSFVGRFPLPVRHGMTIGELARMFRQEFGAACDLRVVEMRGWKRGMHQAETGLPWAPPSPNMPTPATALVYPGGCLVEGTNLSEGRGTTLPFELVGAPWLDARDLAARLRRLDLPGVVFRAASFRPMFQKHAGRPCAGVQVIVSDRDRFAPFVTYLHLLGESLRMDPRSFAWRTEEYEFESARPAIDYLLGRKGLREELERGAAPRELEAGWREGLDAFLELRRRYLLYA